MSVIGECFGEIKCDFGDFVGFFYVGFCVVIFEFVEFFGEIFYFIVEICEY